jgi:DNA primase
MPGVDFNILRAEIAIEDVLSLVEFEPTTRSGPQWHGACPVHGCTSKRSRSFSVNVETGRYFCHKCNSKGNQIELWAAVNKMTLHQAAVDLCRALGREVPWIKRW